MKILDLEFVQQVSLLKIECDCGHIINWPTSVYLVECPKCRRRELWSDDGKVYPGYEDFKVMESKIK